MIYREFNDLTSTKQMTIENQLKRWKLFHEQVGRASKYGIVVGIGDMNFDLEKLENTNYYLKKLAEEQLSMMGENSLEILDFGTTWIRTQKKALYNVLQ